MCGIAGLYQPTEEITDDLLKEMAAPMALRGPDGEGRFIKGPIGLTHRRLSIIDLEGGHQPIFNKDESMAIICNGELYDFEQHREDLIAKGYEFQTHSDSEVILHLYAEHGKACLEMMNGMYAFAIVDFPKQEIFIARDRFGQKPLYFTQEGRNFAFASGPRSLLPLNWLDKSLDNEAIHQFLQFYCIPQEKSIYQNIQKLPPAHYAIWDGFTLELDSYWKYENNSSFNGSYQDAVEQCQSLMKQAVQRRMVADVPVGSFLSGGVDSSIITALAKEDKQDLKTFSIAFSEKQYDERKYSQLVADSLKTDHLVQEVKASDIELVKFLAREYEEPFADASMLPFYLLSNTATKEVTVALSGDGADELFGGYYRYQALEKQQKMQNWPSFITKSIQGIANALPTSANERSKSAKIKRFAKLLNLPLDEAYWRTVSRWQENYWSELYQNDFSAELQSNHALSPIQNHLDSQYPILDQLMSLEAKQYMPDDILVKVDRASMAASLEVRSPFLDKDLAEFAMSLPAEFKMKGSKRKRILEDAFAPKLPTEVFGRKKMGFGVPLAQWFRTCWKKELKEVVMDSNFLPNYFQKSGLKQMIIEHQTGYYDHSYTLYALMNLALWHEQ